MISFYPGPSRIHTDIPRYMLDACDSGVLSENHRSEPFMAISRNCITSLKEKLEIPDDYWIFFTSSATECWHILATSFKFIPSFHVFNGAFGEKWFENNRAIKEDIAFLRFDRELELDISLIPSQSKIICLTQNETSNGTALSNEIIEELRKVSPDSLIMVDATSSLGGVALDIGAADVWFASVQKCFGLPAGLGIMVCSPRAIELAQTCKTGDYNSMVNLHDKMRLWQTPYTPNVLAIYLLMRVSQDMDGIKITNNKLKTSAALYYHSLSKNKSIQLLIKNPKVRSNTVIAVESTGHIIKEIKLSSRNSGILLGNGYGDLSDCTFRIANFPAIQPEEINQLLKFLENY